MRLISIAFLGAALLAAPAYAERAPESAEAPRAVSVQYADLDLSQTDDSQTLLGRLRAAATRACEPTVLVRPGAGMRRAIRRCEGEAMNMAVAQIDAPVVTRLYNEGRR